MTKAEEAAMRAYPPQFSSGKRYAKRVQSEMVDTHAPIRKIFLKGYEQAEKDLALTWEDIRKIVVLFSEVSFECFDTKSANEMCEETLTRFKQYKEASHD